MTSVLSHIDHKGKEIIYINYSKLKGDELNNAIDSVKHYFENSNLRDVLSLTDVTDAVADRPAMAKLQDIANYCRTIEKKSALVGVTGLKKVLVDGVNMLTNRDFRSFDTVAAAKEWLVHD